MSDLIQLSGGTYPILSALNPTPAEREVILELDTGRFKVGNPDGDAYNDLPYWGMEYLTLFFDNRYDSKYAVKYPEMRERTSTFSMSIDCTAYVGGTVRALANDMTIPAPTGTSRQGQTLRYRIKDDGTTRALTWNSIFREVGGVLPTDTVADKVVYVDVVRNTDDDTWDTILVAQQP